jgi:hypothetical protein
VRLGSDRACAEGLARTLARIGEEIEPELYLVSQAARDEWRTLQNRWRPDGAGEKGEPGLTDEEIEALEAKARRFRDIVHALAPKATRDQTRPLKDGATPRGDGPFGSSV